MNPFTVFSLSESFELNESALEQQYFALQRQHHPDRARDASARQAALQQSMDINQAYSRLKNPLLRAQALLALRGVRVNGEQDTIKPDHALLMEVMQWREALEEGSSPLLQEELRNEQDNALRAMKEAFAREDWTKAASSAIRLQYVEKILRESQLNQRP